MDNTVNITVFDFRLVASVDSEIFVAEPIWKWQQTDSGKWVMENALEPPVWYRSSDANTMTYKIAVMARFTKEMATFFQLKYGNYQ
jgi:hypothetical protein